MHQPMNPECRSPRHSRIESVGSIQARLWDFGIVAVTTGLGVQGLSMKLLCFAPLLVLGSIENGLCTLFLP